MAQAAIEKKCEAKQDTNQQELVNKLILLLMLTIYFKLGRQFATI